MCAMTTIWLCPCFEKNSTVETNSNETTLEADSRSDSICLGEGALKLFDY